MEVTTCFSSTSTPRRAEGSEPEAMTMALASWTSSPTLTWPAAGIGRPALDPVYLVLLEQELDAAGVLRDDVGLVGQHLVPVDLRRLADQPHLLEVGLRFMQLLGRVQQRLARDAADVEAGAPQRLAPLDAGGLEPQLGAADGADIAAGAGTDHDDVVAGHGASCRLGTFPDPLFYISARVLKTQTAGRRPRPDVRRCAGSGAPPRTRRRPRHGSGRGRPGTRSPCRGS